MSKYVTIANELRNRIKDGIYPQNSLLPNQKELVDEFNVSRMTIKNAVNILMMEGLVVSKRGVGTLIMNYGFSPNDKPNVQEYQGLSYQMNLQNRTLESKVISFQVTFPDETVQDMLRIGADEPVFEFLRLRIVNDHPYVLEHSFMPVSIVPGLSVDILKHSVYDYILNTLNHTFSGAYRTIQAAKSDENDHLYLDCVEDDPVLELEQVVYLEDGRPIDYSRSRNRYDVRAYSLLDMNPDLFRGGAKEESNIPKHQY